MNSKTLKTFRTGKHSLKFNKSRAEMVWKIIPSIRNVKLNNVSYNQCMLNHSSRSINIMCEAKCIQSDILNGWLNTRVKYRTMAIILRKIFKFML